MHASLMACIPLQAMKQSVAAGPPPAMQSGGQSARATGASTNSVASRAGIRIIPASPAEQFSRVNQARPNGASGAPNGRSGDLADVGRLQPLRALRDLERDPLPLIQGAKAGAGDRRVVDEDVFPIVGGDEPVTLLAVEPLHLALRHGLFPPVDCLLLRRMT